MYRRCILLAMNMMLWVSGQKCDQHSSITKRLEIPITQIKCLGSIDSSKLFSITNEEACWRWQRGMAYHGRSHIICEPVSESGKQKIRCNPNRFSVSGIETHIQYTELENGNFGVWINYKGWSINIQTIFFLGIMVGIVYTVVLMYQNCPMLPTDSTESDDWLWLCAHGDDCNSSWDVPDNGDTCGGWGMVN